MVELVFNPKKDERKAVMKALMELIRQDAK